MGGGKTTQTSENKVDPALMALYNQNYARASAIADTPFQPYTGERVTGFTPTQLQAQGMLSGIANNRTGSDTLAQAKAGYGNLMNYTPAQISAPGAVQAGNVSASPITAGMLRDTDLSAYMNPYTQNVIDTSLSDLSRARDVQRVADNRAATRASAFGRSRQGVADSLTNDAYLRNVSSTSATLRNNDLAGANFRLNAAGGLAGLSDQELNMALKQAGALGAVGDMQQQNHQARDDAAYEDFMRMIGYPAQQQQLRNTALGMMPIQQTTTNTSSKSLGFGDFVGAALGGLATAGKLGLLSDMRVKENIRTIGHDRRGRRWVEFNYRWEPPEAVRQGVIAQEILKTDPEAVLIDPATGLYRVDYSKFEDK
jgi:hypothetical protein